MKFINQFLLQASHGCVRSLFHFPSLSRRLASMLWHVPESIYLMCIERTRYQNNCVRKCKNERNKIYLDIYNIVMILSHTHSHMHTLNYGQLVGRRAIPILDAIRFICAIWSERAPRMVAVFVANFDLCICKSPEYW